MGIGPATVILVQGEDGVYRPVSEDNPLPTTGREGGGAVNSVNGQTGAVVLDAEGVGAVDLDDVSVELINDSVVRRSATGTIKAETAVNGDDVPNKTQMDAAVEVVSLAVANKLDVPTGTASGTTYARGDGTWATPPNTTYTTMSQVEAENADSTAVRTVTGQRLAQAVVANTAALAQRVTDLETTAPEVFESTDDFPAVGVEGKLYVVPAQG